MASALFPLLQKFSRDEWVKLDRNKITPWAFFNSGWPFEITDFYGRTIASQGFEFSGSIRDLFWHRYIEPFLEEIVDRGFNETLRLARDRSQLRREPFEEMGGQLISLSGLAFRRMADIDQRLRGKGKPKSVLLYDPDRELSEVSRFIQRRMRAEIEMLPKSGVDMELMKGHLGIHGKASRTSSTRSKVRWMRWLWDLPGLDTISHRVSSRRIFRVMRLVTH